MDVNGNERHGEFAGIGIWLGWAFEEVCGRTGPYVVAQHSGTGLTLPVCSSLYLLFIDCTSIFYFLFTIKQWTDILIKYTTKTSLLI